MAAVKGRRASPSHVSADPKPLLTASEVARRLSVTRSLAYRLFKTRELRVIYVGCLPRTTEEELAAYLARRQRTVGQP